MIILLGAPLTAVAWLNLPPNVIKLMKKPFLFANQLLFLHVGKFFNCSTCRKINSTLSRRRSHKSQS
jgi:hypothetical protein